MTRQQAIPLAANPAPASAPGTALDEAAAILSGSVFAVLTGAGLSTDSGIPDYRGEGAPVRSPMTFDQFVSDPGYRKRYWAGSHQGWRRFSNAKPNQGHSAIAALEVAGFANGVITQNVDGLHTRAGSQRVVDLHGTMDRVRCLHCGQYYARQQIAERLSASNPWLDDEALVELSPDGDAQVHGFSDFVTPDCSVCGGMLKPDVVFFGELVPGDVFASARSLVLAADALIIAGSSLIVNSGIRLLDLAVRRKMPIVIINRGQTKGDLRATLKIDGGTSEAFTGLVERLR